MRVQSSWRFGWLFVLLLVPLSGMAQDARTEGTIIRNIEDPQYHSTYTPTGPPPKGGYEPYVGAVNQRDQAVIGGVPAYLWWHGCGPTAAGMVMGYYDGHGFGALIEGDASTETNEARQAVATGNGPGTHYSDYSLPIDSAGSIQADLSEAPAGDEHASDSLADFMRTSFSVDNQPYGWSGMSNVDDAMENYTAWVNTTRGAHYLAAAVNEGYGDFTFDDLKGQINNNLPMVFLVDSNGDGGTDHFVTIIGWRDTNGYAEYGCLDTWGTGIRWERFRGLSDTYDWGIAGATYFAIQSLNNPPVADAGDDALEECTGPSGTTVILDGSGSSDPDGDALTYTWSAAGITFDDPHSPTPSAAFPLGTTAVTLTVTDGTDDDTDTVDVTIVDTTPPTIVSCPTDITVECTESCGTPADDAQLTPFFAAFDASDICDDGLALSNDAPLFFDVGPKLVTFTATDASGNSASCTATVTVVDTTPPSINVTFNRDVLWPPNHRMVDIIATVEVSDICDPSPEIVLVDVTSNEPDNAHGDGNTDDDIQGETKDTEDYTFQLRSERRGGGDGRIYTVIYQVTDNYGNSAQDISVIRVPHDQSGHAYAFMGFSADGSGLDDSYPTFGLLIPSRPATYGTDGEGRAILVQSALDAAALDPERVYVGNTLVALRPIDSKPVDADLDGLDDLIVYYRARDLEGAARSAIPDLIEDRAEIDYRPSDGPIGLHYSSHDGDYLVADIFDLGAPFVIVASAGAEQGKVGSNLDPQVQAEPRSGDAPRATQIAAVYPNPFNPSTTISLYVKSSTRVTLRIFDSRGGFISELRDETMGTGYHDITWDGRDRTGQTVSAGVYFAQMLAGPVQQTQKLILIK